MSNQKIALAQLRVEKLERHHGTADFSCGKPLLDDWLRKHALTNQANGSARTCVACDGEKRVWGYYALAPGEVGLDVATERARKGLARRPIPAILLARLACDSAAQGSGLGKALLKHALEQALLAHDLVGARVILVHALDEEARSFYEHFGFEPSLLEPFTLMLLMKDAQAMREG